MKLALSLDPITGAAGTLGTLSQHSSFQPDRPPSVHSAGLKTFERQCIENARDLSEFSMIWRTMTAVSPFVMARTLWELGWLRTDGQRFTSDDVAKCCASVEKYRSLMAQWLDVLAVAGFIRRLRPEYPQFIANALDIRAVRERIDHATATVNIATSYQGFIEYFLVCVREQARLLTGMANPQKLLFPLGSWHLVDALYRTNPASMVQNKVVATVVSHAAQQWTSSRPMRILEVGAGTGATTSAVLAEARSADFEYWFTDISRFFIKRASRQFTSDRRIRFDLLDIDRLPAEQGFDGCTFDLIVAANVLHTAKRIDTTLAYLRGLLADAGALLVVETTSNTPLQMITFGHFDGVCHFQDARRDSNLPFLSSERWMAAMRASGFSDVTCVPETENEPGSWSQHVIMATRGKA